MARQLGSVLGMNYVPNPPSTARILLFEFGIANRHTSHRHVHAGACNSNAQVRQVRFENLVEPFRFVSQFNINHRSQEAPAPRDAGVLFGVAAEGFRGNTDAVGFKIVEGLLHQSGFFFQQFV